MGIRHLNFTVASKSDLLVIISWHANFIKIDNTCPSPPAYTLMLKQLYCFTIRTM